MAYDLEEQEQIATIKSWWQQYGNLVTTAVLALAVGLAGVQGWRYYRGQQAVAAATLYHQVEYAEKANDGKRVKEIAARLAEKYASTPYAAMAALRAAKVSAQANDLAAAKLNLQWVIDNAREDEQKDVARMRLAGVLLDEKKFDEALKLLDTAHGASFDGLYADMRGDILAIQGKRAEARAAYQTAIEKSAPGSNYRPLIQVKLDTLGDAK
jgi:predicted negative regulator of RcsB-dependent stress response